MTEKLILEKLSNLERHSMVMEKKVDKIETAVGLIAVQSERIDNISAQVQALWLKHDEVFSPSGIINQIKIFQASCPKDQVKETIHQQWVVIGLLATIVCGTLLKALGIV